MKKSLTIGFLFLMHTLVLSQDWANLERYQAENEQIIPGEHPVVFIGNSITEGWVRMMPEFFEQNQYLGRGIGGQTTPQMLLRFRQDVIDLKPNVVIILAGTNDIAGNTGPMTLEQIMDNIKSMAELSKANHINVILSSVLPAFNYPWAPGKAPNMEIPKLNALIKSYCEKEGHHYLDYYSAMVGSKNDLREELTYDGVHPNEAGYQMMAPLANKAIRQVLGH